MSVGVSTTCDGGAPVVYEKTLASICSFGSANIKKIVIAAIAIIVAIECFIINAVSLSTGCLVFWFMKQ